MRPASAIIALGAVLSLGQTGVAQDYIPGQVEVAFNRYYDYSEILEHLKRIEAAYPELVDIVTIGQSREGRDMVVVIVNAGETGDHRTKPAMWIDANVHGNEIQGGEVVLYSVWYLTKAYGANQALTELLDAKSFYFLPSQNPDGRDWWFHKPNTSSSSRGSKGPVDSDSDGLFDEDPYDDLDGDGSITTMWKEDPQGRWVRDKNDLDGFRRAEDGEDGGWERLGSEGIDNDGDGAINEDGPGGDDMNRNWPSDWQPPHVQGGAGEYPLSNPETRCIAEFILDHPNIAAVQSYHNAGGMILRGPGAAYRDSIFPREDIRVYDELGQVGEQMLPFYRYMIIHKDLYTVHGGFVNWTAEGLGIFSFTNELWSSRKMFQIGGGQEDAADRGGRGGFGGGGGDRDEQARIEQERLRFASTFKDYTWYDHPTHGRVLIGGRNRWSSRATPSWLLEEECHRNFAFTMLHADHMPRLRVSHTASRRLRDDLFAVTVEIENERLIPTRSGLAADKRIGTPDLLQCDVAEGVDVVAAGRVDRVDAKTFTPVEHEPTRLVVNEGIPSEGRRAFRFLVRGNAGDKVRLAYTSDKAKDLDFEVELSGE